MDLKSGEFIDSVENLLDVDKKKVVVVIHQKLKHIVTDQFRVDRLIASIMDKIDSEQFDYVGYMA